MASTGAGSGSLPLDFYLTPQQQSLLFTALNANRQPSPGTKTGLALSPNLFKPSSSHSADHTGFQESPYLDNYDYDLGDSGFDFSFAGDSGQAHMIGDYPADTSASMKSESSENDLLEKRSHPDDEDSDESPGNESKRHEGSDKIPKKPGRKPLTSEPTSKRKAQNRAAQRAFRERKEKHLKDLETKVEELEKISEAANSENSLLRAQVDRITSELNHYKQQMALMSTKPTSQSRTHPFGTSAANNITDLNFQFEFPKYGTLPGQPTKMRRSPSQPISPPSNQTPSPAASLEKENKPQAPRKPKFSEGFAKFSGLMTPSMSSTNVTGGSGPAVDAANIGNHGDVSSPSTSSHSNMGPSSSCGTSPEAFTQSPTSGAKPVDTLTTIAEQQHPVSAIEQPFVHFAENSIPNGNSLDWLVQQNGGQFEPQLFGNYREPQDNVLANPAFDELFTDPPENDFVNPYNMGPGPHKTNLIDRIDAQKYAIDEGTFQHEGMRFNSIWHKMQTFPEVQEGDFDLDGLCSELTKKAKCSGHGPVVAEGDFDTILNKYMGRNYPPDMAKKAGVRVQQIENQTPFPIPSALQRSA